MSTRFYHPHMLAAEREIAARLRNLVKSGCDKIEAYTEGLKGEQPKAVETACQHRVSVLFGPPGTGKTTTSNAIIRSFDRAGLKGMIVSPTAKAAKRASEVINDPSKPPLQTELPCLTVHRALEYSQFEEGFARNQENPLDVDYIGMDETSMADTPIFCDFLRAIDPSRTRLFCLGDPYQLPSIGPGNVLHDLINSRVIPSTQLTQVFRTGANSGIAYNAGLILNGEMPAKIDPRTNEAFNDFFFVHRPTPEQTADFILESVTKKIPAQRGVDSVTEIQVLSPGKKSEVGTTALNKRLREALNPGKEIYRGYRLNDKVINRKNIRQVGVVNGDVGKIIEISDKGLTVDFGVGAGLAGDGIVDYRADNEYANGDSLHHAYCFTIHSSQGSEFPVVIMPCHNSHYKLLFRNLIYTGITRAKKLACIVGDVNALRHAIETSVTDKRMTGLQEWLRQELPLLAA